MKEGMKGPKQGIKGFKQGKNRQIHICQGKDTCIRRFFAAFFPCAGIFLLTIAFLAALLVLTSCIPNESIKKRLLDSALSYQQKEPYVFGENGRFNGIADNYADAILLNVLWNIKSDDPVRSALDTQYYDGEEYGENWGLYCAINGTEPNTDYSRYWHGSVIWLRPLLLVADVDQIKLIGLGAAVFLLGINLILLFRQKQYFAAVALTVSLLAAGFLKIRLSLEYQPAFLVCLLMCIFFLLLEKKKDVYLLYLSVVSGVSIAFVDFLTTELLTILVPLILVFIVRAESGRVGTLKKNIWLAFRCGLAWVLSYAMTFVTKWAAVSLATGENRFLTSIASAEVRMYGVDAEEGLPLIKQIPYAVFANLSTLFGGRLRVDFPRMLLGMALVFGLWGAIYYLFHGQKNREMFLLMLLLGVVPYVRYLALSNHSYLHEFFTYRAQVATILAMLAALWFQLDKSLLPFTKGRKRTGQKKRGK